MTTVYERAAAALDTLGYPYAQGLYITDSQVVLPDLYLVYTLISAPPQQHADEAETLRSYRIQVSVYSRSGLVSLPDVDTAMIAAGFVRGPRTEIPYNTSTRHFGLALEYVYLNEE